MFRFASTLTVVFGLSLIASAEESVGHRVLAADRGKGHIVLLGADGKVEWEIENKHDVHDLQMLPNGNILTHTSPTTVVEIEPKSKKTVWTYEAKPKEGYKGRIEIHAFQRLSDGNTMVAESGNTRIVEVNNDGKIVKTVPLTVKQPDAHRDTRMVRKLENGHYLVCHEGEGSVVEYDGDGKIVWKYILELGDRKRSPGHGVEGHGVEVYGATRLKNGNTLIGGGNNNRVLEVDSNGKIVWQIDQKDLPGITLAWVTTVAELPNGNIVFGNCHAGPDNPQLIEVTKEKKVVWTLKDHKNLANDTATAIIVDLK